MTAAPSPSDSQASQALDAESEAVRTREGSEETPDRPHLSASVRRLLAEGDGGPVLSGEVARQLLASHPGYIARGLPFEAVAVVGEQRTTAEHVQKAAEAWAVEARGHQHGRSVLVGLAVTDPDLGRALLLSGLWVSLLSAWPEPGETTLSQPTWDRLSRDGRTSAMQVPAMVTSLGGPPDWAMVLPRSQSVQVQMVWSPDDAEVGVFDAGLVRRVTADGVGSAEAPLLRRGVETEEPVWGWASDGPVRCEVVDGSVTVVDGRGVTEYGEAAAAWLSGDGQRLMAMAATAQLNVIDVDSGGLLKTSSSSAGVPVAVDPSGRFVLLDAGGGQMAVWDTERLEVAGSDPALWVGTGQDAAGARALSPPFPPRPQRNGTVLAAGTDVVRLRLLTVPGVASAPVPDFLEIPLPVPARALAFSRRGDRLAILAGDQLRVVSVGLERPAAPIVAVGVFSSDQAVGEDLVGVDRDVNALAALLCSADLRAPLTVGILGNWGSGKSFVLSRLRQQVAAYARAGHASGFVSSMRIVDFNAWHYAESDIWASLVEQARLVLTAPDLETATSEREKSEKRLQRLRRRLDWGRRLLWTGLALATLLLATAAALALHSRDLSTAWTSALAATATVTALAAAGVEALSRSRAAFGVAAAELAKTGQQGQRILNRLYGRQAAAELEVAEADLRARRIAEEVARVGTGGTAPQSEAGVPAALRRFRDSGDYAARLTLVAHSRRLFDDLSRAVAEDAGARDDGIGLERALVVIDDLDRCPPDKVVDVLQAVHLLFDFPIFTVVLAVDTRWLRQALHAHYRELLGGAAVDAADPMDYLEKIIQMPIQLRPMGDRQVRRMVEALTGDVAVTATYDPEVRQRTSSEAARPDEATPGSRRRDGSLEQPVSQRQNPGGRPIREDGAALRPDSALAGDAALGEQPILAATQLQLGVQEKLVLSGLAPLVGVTPRTVKRYVNIYQLLRAREADLAAFASGDEPVAEFAVVAFLLALATGQRNVAADLFAQLASSDDRASLGSVCDAVRARSGPAARELRAVRSWLAARPDWSGTPAGPFRRWAPEVARFSFVRTASQS